MKERHQRRRTIDHRCVDHLALTRLVGFEDGAHHAEREVHTAAAKIADKVERRYRRLTGPAHRLEGTGERDVVDVVSGRAGVGTFRPQPVMRP